MKNSNILIVDYGIGNVQSIKNILRYLKYDFAVSSSPEEIQKADFFILPGVGAFEEAMKNLRQSGIIELLEDEVLIKKKPILGLCLGMQLFAESSLEGGLHEGLGWVEGHVKGMKEGEGFPLPHVGWNSVRIEGKSPLFNESISESYFYFDHSYFFECDPRWVVGTSDYQGAFAAAIQKDNIFGVQFHPEKSQNAGMSVLKSLFESFLPAVMEEKC